MATRMNRRDLLKGAAAVGAATVAAACTPGSTTNPNPSASAAPSATVSQDREFVLATIADLNSLDPALIRNPEEHENALHMYNGLVRWAYHADTVKVEPDLAESWTVSADGKVWTYKLRQGVKFHKGFGEFTSDDVKFHFERLLLPATGSQARSSMTPISAVDAPDKYTVRVTMKTPYLEFNEALVAWRWALIPSRKAVEQFGKDYPQNPVGTGAYVYEGRVPRQEIRWTANPDYFRGKPRISRVKLVIIPEQSVAALALQRGEVHALNVFAPEVFRSLKGNSSVTVVADPSRSNQGYFFNVKKAPLDNVKLRQAMATAIDRTAIVTALEGMAVPSWSIVPQGAFGFTTSVDKHDYDPVKAKQLLTDAGFANGFTLSVFTRAEDVPYVTVISDQLRKIGVQSNVRVLESAAFGDAADADNAEWQAIVGGINRPTPEQQVSQYDGRLPRSQNQTLYNNPKYNALLDQLATETNQSARQSILEQCQKIVADEVPTLVMTSQLQVVAYHNSISGYARNLVNRMVIVEDMSVHQEVRGSARVPS